MFVCFFIHFLKYKHKIILNVVSVHCLSRICTISKIIGAFRTSQFDGTLAQQQQQDYGSLVKQNLSDRHSVLPLALVPEHGFNSRRYIVWLNDIYYSELAVWGKNVSCSHKTLLEIVLARCRSCSWVPTRRTPQSRGLVVGGITSLFAIFHLALTDCPSAWVGGPDPSLPRHLDQRQTAELKCHFNFLAALVTAGLALSPGYSCNFHIMWCQKGYFPSISHSDPIHLSSLSVTPVVR